jgi:serine/threonine protein kinase
MAMMRLRREDPRVVGSYRLHRRLGTGGMGVVYLGSDRRGQRVALKLIRPELAGDPEFRTRFAREVAAAARIRGGCTARLVAADLDADRPWLATAYVPGPSLYKKVGDEGPLPWPEVASIGSALAEGLVHVHEAGVVHRDLKPSNILLSPKGPRIIDFGIAWSRGASTLTHVGTAVGSPGFLAPEQVRGAAVTPATDVFALGATLAYAATGDSPFGSGTSEVMLYRVVHEEPDLGAVPGSLAPLIRACLAKEPVDRPGTARLYERLRELAARGAASSAPRPPEPRRAPQPVPRRPAALPDQSARRRPTPGQAPTVPVPQSAAGGVGPGHPTAPTEARGSRPRLPVDRSRTPLPGRPVPPSRQRLLRQQLMVFVTVTLGVALAIAAAQGCRSRTDQGLGTPRGGASSLHHTAGRMGGSSADGVAPSASTSGPLPVAEVPGATPAGGGALTASTPVLPAVDWRNRTYTDPDSGAVIRLRAGRARAGGVRVSLTAVLPARYRGAPAAVVVLQRTEGAVPVDLVELFGLAGRTPALLASRASTGDPRAVASWRIDRGALVRVERVSQTGAVTETRYTVRGDGTLEESWPGSATSGGAG